MSEGCFGEFDPDKPKRPPSINLGSAFSIDFFIKDKSQKPHTPVDITGASEIVVIMLNNDGTFLELKLSLTSVSIINAVDGHFRAKGTASQSALLKPSAINLTPPGSPDYSDIEAHITTVSGDVLVVLFPQSINLIPRLFPTAP